MLWFVTVLVRVLCDIITEADVVWQIASEDISVLL